MSTLTVWQIEKTASPAMCKTVMKINVITIATAQIGLFFLCFIHFFLLLLLLYFLSTDNISFSYNNSSCLAWIRWFYWRVRRTLLLSSSSSSLSISSLLVTISLNSRYCICTSCVRTTVASYGSVLPPLCLLPYEVYELFWMVAQSGHIGSWWVYIRTNTQYK